VASPPDERIPRPDQNFISRGLREHGKWERELQGGKGGKWGGENGDASGAFIGAKELVKRPVSRYCLFFLDGGRGCRGGLSGRTEISRAMTV